MSGDDLSWTASGDSVGPFHPVNPELVREWFEHLKKDGEMTNLKIHDEGERVPAMVMGDDEMYISDALEKLINKAVRVRKLDGELQPDHQFYVDVGYDEIKAGIPTELRIKSGDSMFEYSLLIPVQHYDGAMGRRSIRLVYEVQL